MADQVKINRRMITPEMAKKYLKLNSSNRKMSQAHVTRLANSIKNGEWKFCGESIKISVNNKLLDGQHRLAAIIEADKAIELVVVEGLPEETFHVIDTSKKARSTADVLHISGEKNTNVLAAAVTLVGAYEKYDDLTNRSYRPSIKDTEDVLARHPKIRDYSNPRSNLYRLTGPGIAVALSYLFSLSDKKVSEQFIERLATGVGLEKNNPILQLRDILLNNKSARNNKLSKTTIAALMIKAFNLYRANKSIAKLRFGNDESFPKIDGMPKIK